MKRFKRFCAHEVRVVAQKTRLLVAKVGVRRGNVLSFCEELDEPYSCNGTVELIQALETVRDSDVKEYLRHCLLKPGQAAHIVSLLIVQPELVRVIVPAGKPVTSLENPANGGSMTSELPIGGPIVALDSPDEKWCAVLCDDPKGPIFCDGFINGDGWKAGTFYVALPDRSEYRALPPSQLLRRVQAYEPPIFVH